jgi:protein-S-isoprenylcysteine O-methyltransferase Ste14
MRGSGRLPKQNLQQRMYGFTGASKAQRVALAILLACCVAIAWWLLVGGGIITVSGWFGRRPIEGNLARRACLAAAFAIYFVRVLFTEFVFLKRGVSWNEVFTIAPWVLFIFVLLAFAAGFNAAPFGSAAIAGAVLFVLGSWMNSYAEYQRHAWKQRPENRGRLYTAGLFCWSLHPNYLGDLLSFSGVCLISGRWFTAVVPVLMLCGFVFVNIPVLDAHLREHYGQAFDDYARKTRKLVPFVY